MVTSTADTSSTPSHEMKPQGGKRTGRIPERWPATAGVCTRAGKEKSCLKGGQEGRFPSARERAEPLGMRWFAWIAPRWCAGPSCLVQRLASRRVWKASRRPNLDVLSPELVAGQRGALPSWLASGETSRPPSRNKARKEGSGNRNNNRTSALRRAQENLFRLSRGTSYSDLRLLHLASGDVSRRFVNRGNQYVQSSAKQSENLSNLSRISTGNRYISIEPFFNFPNKIVTYFFVEGRCKVQVEVTRLLHLTASLLFMFSALFCGQR